MVSVVADPVTVRKCGSRKDEPDSEKKGCAEKLQGNDKVRRCIGKSLNLGPCGAIQ